MPGNRRPPLRLPRSRPLVEPISTVNAGFFRSRAFYFRFGVLAAVTVGIFSVLVLRLWSLQVLQGPRFAKAAQQQTFRNVSFPAPRAPIFDRRGHLLVGTRGRLVVTADPATLGAIDSRGRWWASSEGRRVLSRLGRLARVPATRLAARIRAGVRRSPYAPAVVVRSVPRGLAFYLDERAPAWRGLRVASLPERRYPLGPLGGEFLGLLGEIGPRDLRRPRYRGVRPGQIVGHSGIEASYDRLLNGGLAWARVPVDSRGRVVGPLLPLQGRARTRGLKLTIDARLQQVAQKAILDGIDSAHKAGHLDANAGAAVVLDPWTGAVRALASYPGFDQSAAARDPAYLERLLDPTNRSVPLLNRATQGLYPTGSTFKPIVAEAALSAGLISPSTFLPCTGSLTVGNIVFHNVEPGVNASLDLQQALSISCDTWFYRLGTMFYARQQATGSLDMQRWAGRLGLGHTTGIDVPGEAGGVVPTPAWLKRTFTDPAQRIWYEGYSVNLSIGQGYLAVTPLQLAVAYAALANGGTVVRPHVAGALVDGAGRPLRRLRFPPRKRLLLTDQWAIRDGLYSAAHFGTSAAIFADFPVPVAGKTGTAETPTGSDHSWYASWAPARDPRVVVVVLIEHGGFGVEAAAPAAKEIYTAFFHLAPKQ